MSGRAFKYFTQAMRSILPPARPAVAPYHSRVRKLGRRWPRACPSRPVRNMPVMTVALDRLAASFADCVFERGDGLLLRRRGAGHVENFFLQDCSVEVVHTVTQRDLSERQSEANPIRRQVVDVVKVNA